MPRPDDLDADRRDVEVTWRDDVHRAWREDVAMRAAAEHLAEVHRYVLDVAGQDERRQIALMMQLMRMNRETN